MMHQRSHDAGGVAGFCIWWLARQSTSRWRWVVHGSQHRLNVLLCHVGVV